MTTVRTEDDASQFAVFAGDLKVRLAGGIFRGAIRAYVVGRVRQLNRKIM